MKFKIKRSKTFIVADIRRKIKWKYLKIAFEWYFSIRMAFQIQFQMQKI